MREAEVKIAHQLIQALAGEWQPEKYHDTFEDNLRKMIQAKLEGKEVTPVEKPKKPAPVVDLMAALKESLNQMKKPPQSVTEAQEASETHTKPKKHAKAAGRKRAA